MRIKKHRNKNEYLLTEDGVWVRNFTRKHVPSIDINTLADQQAYQLWLANEFINTKRAQDHNYLDVSNFDYPDVLIASDGYDFANKQELIAQMPSDRKVVVLAANGALANWKLTHPDREAHERRGISCYIVNNPYPECMKFFPQRSYFPTCIAADRTYPKFIDKYRGGIFFYANSPTEFYSSQQRIKPRFTVDDYRNPICAAIHLAYLLRARKILIFCCDDSFKDKRPAAVQLENGLWTYPQQIITQRIIDAQLYWLAKEGIVIGSHSSGIKFNNATYITDDQVPNFFKEEQEDHEPRQVLSQQL